MPQRSDRFFWLYGKQLDRAKADEIKKELVRFKSTWKKCACEIHSCVSEGGTTNRLWLFQLTCGIEDEKIPQEFNKRLAAQVKELENVAELTRRSNALTPLIIAPSLEDFPKIDIGLHPVNDRYNGMLVTYIYNQSPLWHPAHLQLVTLRMVSKRIEEMWKDLRCECFDRNCKECSGDGCYDCFQEGCKRCVETGWKDYFQWERNGFQIDYHEGFPTPLC